MSFIYIKLNGTLSDALYQACTGFAVCFHIGKKLAISVDDIYSHNAPMFNKIKQYSVFNCQNSFYEHVFVSSIVS
jgi:hypothetical protein